MEAATELKPAMEADRCNETNNGGSRWNEICNRHTKLE